MTHKTAPSKLENALVFGALFLAGMNFAAKFFWFVFLALLALALLRGKLRVDGGVWLYAALGVQMAVFNADEGTLSMLRFFAPCACYLIGLNGVDADDPRKRAHALIGTVAAGAFTHFLLNFLYAWGRDLGRNTNDIWTGAPMAATVQAALALPMLALAAAALVAPTRRWHRVAAVAVMVLSLCYDLKLAVRAMPILLLIVLAASVCYNAVCAGRVRLRRGYLALALLPLSAAGAYVSDVGGVRTRFAASEMAARLGSFWDNSLRARAKWNYLKNLPASLFGGEHLRRRFGYAHDLLLDGYDAYGLMGAALLFGTLIDGAVRLYRLLRRTDADRFFKTATLALYLAIWAEFTLEPILEGMSWLFCTYCLLNGLLGGMEYEQRRRLP